MIDRKKNIVFSLLGLTALVASITLAFGIGGRSLVTHAQQALRKSVTRNEYPTPAGSYPWGTAFDSKGRVWLAMPGCDPSPTCASTTAPGKIDVYDPSVKSWAGSYQLPSGYGQPLFLAFDQHGMLWFPMPMTNTLGMFNPVSKTFQEWAVPTAGSGPWGVAIDSAGRVWFTEHYGYKIGCFDPSTHTFKEVATPATNSIPYGIVVDASNNVWFTENSSSVALIGEYTAANHLKEYKIRNGSTSGVTPHLITIDPNGNIWWTEGWATAIGELRIAAAVPGTNSGVTEYSYPHPYSNGSHASGISVDGYGQIWFDDSLQNTFGSFPDSGKSSFTMYDTYTSNSHPHDGMNVDKQNRVWFDEEFANKLALATSTNGGNSSPTPGTSPTPSPTVGSSPTPSPTPPTTPTPSPTPGATLGTDTFQRANQTYWGKASDGQVWGGDANTASIFSISANAGVVSNGGSASYSAVLGPTTSNAQVLFTGSLSSFSNSNIGAVLRWTDGNNWYKAYIDGSSLVLQKKVAGAAAVLSTTPFTATASTSYTLRFQVVGPTLNAKVWATGSTEPSSWMATVNDTSFSSGYCGLRMLAQSGITATFTSFRATSM